MKGLVLAGGKGSRLRPFTYSGAKQLVPIANTPVLHFPVRQLVEAGIRDIGIVVGDNEEQIRAAMGAGRDFGAQFTYIRQPAPLGLAHGILVAREFLGGAPFVMYLGDNVLVGGIANFVTEFENTGEPAVIVKAVDDPRAFGVADVANGHIVEVVEKPTRPASDLAVIGVYAFGPDVFEIIERQAPSARGELEIADTINGLAARRGVRAMLTREKWIDTGKMDDMLDANRTILALLAASVDASAVITATRCEGVVIAGSGALVDGCEIVGPVAIGEGARIVASRIGPNVAVGPGALVERSAVADAIIMEEAVVRDCPGIAQSMVGRFAHVCGAPAGTRLTLGDHSRFEAGE